MEIVAEKYIDFNSLEKEIYNRVCELGVRLIQELLENTDKELAEKRDKEKYRHKGFRKNSIKTVMGTVEYSRAIYEHKTEEGKKVYIYLLDKEIKMQTIGKISTNLLEKCLEEASTNSYRRAAKHISDTTGQAISHGGVWNMVNQVGSKIEKQEKQKIELYKAGQLNGEREVKVIFEEADGLWLNMQGKDKPKEEKSHKKEIKLAVHYEGWERRNNGKRKEYIVKNKGVVAGFTAPGDFKYLRDVSLAEKYNMDEIEYRILNGDGASWIRHNNGGDCEYFQLDRFHVSQCIVRCVKDKEEARKLRKLFNRCKFKSFMDRINELKYECGGEYEEIKKLQVLENYIKSNAEGIIPYKKRLKIPKPPRGIFYRNLGTMEHNIFDVLGFRMKGHKMSWSIQGANHLAKILAAKASGKLYDVIASLPMDIPESSVQRFEEILIAMKVGYDKNIDDVNEVRCKNFIYPIHRARLPYSSVPLNEFRKSIRRIFDEKFSTQLRYI